MDESEDDSRLLAANGILVRAFTEHFAACSFLFRPCFRRVSKLLSLSVASPAFPSRLPSSPSPFIYIARRAASFPARAASFPARAAPMSGREATTSGRAHHFSESIAHSTRCAVHSTSRYATPQPQPPIPRRRNRGRPRHYRAVPAGSHAVPRRSRGAPDSSHTSRPWFAASRSDRTTNVVGRGSLAQKRSSSRPAPVSGYHLLARRGAASRALVLTPAQISRCAACSAARADHRSTRTSPCCA